MKSIEILVPEEIVNLLGSEDAVRKEAREAFVLDLVRRGKVSKGKAAELLGISLWDLPDLIEDRPDLGALDLVGLENPGSGNAWARLGMGAGDRSPGARAPGQPGQRGDATQEELENPPP